MKIVQELITTLDLQSHPEGGFFKETYRSSETFEKECLPTKYSGPRNVATSIYFLLTSNSFRHFIVSNKMKYGIFIPVAL